jgi:large subunit ribosomal protein L17
MRHRKKVNHLGRKSAHRQAMLSNMAASLILHKRIKTTLQKAKALRVYVEPLINRSKDNTTHSRRVVFGYLQNKEAVTELFRDIADKVADRPGGYTRILKIENRIGDNAEMCYIELVDYNENMLKTDTKKAGTRRSRRSSGKSTTTETATPKPQTPEAKEAPEAKATPVVEQAIEEASAEAPEIEVAETPEMEEAPEVEEVVEETPVVEEAPVAEEIPTVEEVPAIEETPIAEETPVAEEVVETPVAEEAPATEDAPAAEEEKPEEE